MIEKPESAVGNQQSGGFQANPNQRSIFHRLLSPSIYPEEEKNRTARLLNTVLLLLMVATIFVYFTMFATENRLAVFIATSAMLLMETISFLLLRTGRLRAASVTLCVGLWVVLAVISVNAEGVSNVPFIALVLIVTMAGLLLGGKVSVIFAALNGIFGLILLIAELNGVLPNPLIPYNLTSFWISMNVIFFASAGLIYMANRGMREAIQRAQQNERAQEKISSELFKARASLEQQVDQRTRELQKRTDYLQSSVEVSRAIASILDTDQLIQQAVTLIKERFGLYYVGLFLVDTSGEWAVLRSGTGAAGEALMERGHRIRVGTGMIGWSIVNAQSRVSLDVSEDFVRLSIPELPETSSEAALPLRSRGQVLGAMTVQSELQGAFGDIEISTFQSLADQLAIALDNANLLRESQRALETAQIAFGKATRQAWEEYLRTAYEIGYRYDRKTITPLSREQEYDAEWQPEARQVAETGQKLQVADEHGSTLYLPLMVRDQVIGVLNLYKEGESWTDDEILLVETITGQLSITLDGARLYQDTQRLAFREQMAGEVTSRIRETLDVDTIVRTAAQEIQLILGLPEVVISLGTPEADKA